MGKKTAEANAAVDWATRYNKTRGRSLHILAREEDERMHRVRYVSYDPIEDWFYLCRVEVKPGETWTSDFNVDVFTPKDLAAITMFAREAVK